MSQIPASLGPYKIVRELGRGGMGVVYEAQRPDLGKSFALKVMLSQALADAESLTRFLREARALARIDRHPNIVTVFDVGELHEAQGEDLHYFAMEFVEGGSLEVRLDDQDMTPRKGAEIVAKVARALHHAHGHGIIHRDIKPANILLSPDGEPKITDFGLARDATSQTRVTTSGTAMGTPVYMSPEQAAGKVSMVDELSDVYSLGALLYEVLIGLPPFDGASPAAVLFQVLYRDPKRPGALNPDIHPELEAIVLKALEKEKHRRYASAAEFAEDLERWLDGRPVRAKPPGLARRVWKRARRNKAIVAGSLVALMALVFAGGVGVRSVISSVQRERAEAVKKRLEQVALEFVDDGQKRLEKADRYRFMHGVEVVEMIDEMRSAEQQFSRAIDLAPHLAQAWHYRGRVRYMLSRWSSAEQDLTRCLEIVPDYLPALIDRAEVRLDIAGHLRGGFYDGGSSVDSRGNVYGKPKVRPRPENPQSREKTRGAARDMEAALRLSNDPAQTDRLRALHAFADARKERNLDNLVDLFTRAIATDPTNPDNLLDRARTYYQFSQFEKSLADAKKAAEIAPNYFMVYHRQGMALTALGRNEEAREVVRKGLQFNPDDIDLRRLLAWADMFSGGIEKALLELGKIRDRKPGYIDHEIGVAYFKLKDYDKALTAFASASELNPDLPSNFINAGICQIKLGRPEEAISWFARAFEKDPHDPVALSNRGLAYRRTGRAEQAEADYRAALELAPDHVPALMNLAVLLFKTDRFEEAVATNEKALSLQPEDPVILFNHGELLREWGKQDEALAFYRKALHGDESLHMAHFGIGKILASKGQIPEALRALQKALDAYPDNPGILLWIAKAEVQRQHFDQAEAWYTKSLEQDPENAEAYIERALARARQGKFELALKDTESAIDRKPDYEIARLTRAKLLLETGQVEKAWEALEKMVADGTENAEVHAYRGQIRFGYQDYKVAEAEFTRAIELETGAKAFWYGARAEARFRMKDMAGCIADTSKALEEDPDFVRALVRRGVAYLSSRHPDEAMADFKRVIELEPGARESLEGAIKKAEEMKAAMGD